MATIPRAALDYLTQQINGISAEAQSKVLRVLQQISWTPENIAQCRDVVLEALALVMPTYTDMAAQASADFYDAERVLAIGEPFGAEAISGYDQDRTSGAVRGFVQRIVDNGDVQGFNDQVLQRIDYEMKRAAGNSMLENGRKDPKGPRFARVPTGSETCSFCLMLASRGFVYRSEKSAGELDHYHANCDCRIVASFDADTVEGYDPDDLYLKWKDPEGWAEAHSAQLGRRFGHVDGLPGTEVVDGTRFDASDPEDVRRFVDRYSAEIRSEPVEHVYVLQADGTVRHAVGTEDAVSLEGAEMSGAVIVHNHPIVNGEALSFGSDDFDLMKSHPEIGAFYAVNDEYNYFATIADGFDGVFYNDGYAGVAFGDNDDIQHLMMEWFNEQGYINYRRDPVRSDGENL